MIIRIVKMQFRPEEAENFRSLFNARKQAIRAFQGCLHLELWQDTKDASTFFTYSIWDHEKDLNHYRFSAFFKETWGLTKALFSDKPEAWSLERQASL